MRAKEPVKNTTRVQKCRLNNPAYKASSAASFVVSHAAGDCCRVYEYWVNVGVNNNYKNNCEMCCLYFISSSKTIQKQPEHENYYPENKTLE